jgi:hypothetical protein
MEVGLFQVTLVTVADPLPVTVALVWKPVPVIVHEVLPLWGDVQGLPVVGDVMVSEVARVTVMAPVVAEL